MLNSRPRGCVTALCPSARHINPSLELVQPRKTHPFITERLLMGCKESNQTNCRLVPHRPCFGVQQGQNFSKQLSIVDIKSATTCHFACFCVPKFKILHDSPVRIFDYLND